MMQLSRWKFVTVTAAIIFGLLFTLPNMLPAGVRDAMPGFLPKKRCTVLTKTSRRMEPY